MNWTSEQTEELARLAGLGMSARQIADQIGGFSRNAVIGRALRKGITIRSTNASPARQKPAYRRPLRSGKVIVFPKPMPMPVEPPADCPPAAIEDVSLAVRLTEVHMYGCRFCVSGESRPMLFCNAPATEGPEGRKWCESHRARVYQERASARRGNAA